MVGADDAHDADPATYDRHRELKRFDDSKAGVKGLADSGVARLPRFFLRPPEDIAADRPGPGPAAPDALEIPVIDLGSLAAGGRPAAVARVLEAAREVGFFQVVNHGIPEGVLAEVLAAGRAFHELPAEVKAGYYSREAGRRVKFTSNFDLYESKHANWRDTMFCVMGPEPLDPLELPPVCRDMMMEYSKQVKALGNTLFELLSEALGLKPDHLVKMDCAKGHALLCHYYPACPEPDLTMGTTKHSDPDFLTILLQDHIGGLQIYYRDQWVDVPPVAGALVVNIGDLLQLISNDIFKSVWHRVLASHVGPRLSVACFFTLHLYPTTRTYGPIKEILSEDRPALYREISLREFITCYDSKGLDGTSALTHFRMRNWAELPQELLQLFSLWLCLKNLSAFRAVCRSWRSAAVKIPWLMLTDKNGMPCPEFFCLSCQQVHKKLLPEMMANGYFSSLGWVLMTRRDGKFHMLKNPMSCYDHIIDLPNWNKLPNIEAQSPFYVEFVSKFVLSDCPTTSPDYKVMVIYDFGKLGLWKPGEKEWTAVKPPADKYEDVIYYNGSFFAVDNKDRILRCNVDGPPPFEAQVVFQVPQGLQEFEHEYPRCVNQVYLVQSTTGSLLFVSKWQQQTPTITFQFRVLKIDLDTQTCTKVEDLKNSTSLFLGLNSSFSLKVDEDHLIKPNCIYFTYSGLSLFRSTGGGVDTGMGIYHLEDGTVELHVEGKSSRPLWVEPCF